MKELSKCLFCGELVLVNNRITVHDTYRDFECKNCKNKYLVTNTLFAIEKSLTHEQRLFNQRENKDGFCPIYNENGFFSHCSFVYLNQNTIRT
jgi:DNA-directed RNA polymerase subunit RPC12/RpoP